MEEREEIITLVDEEGEKFDFLVVDYFFVENQEYAVLLPCDQNGSAALEGERWGREIDLDEDEEDAVIFRVIKGNNGETALHMIEDEDEWEKVVEIAYERLLADEEEDIEED